MAAYPALYLYPLNDTFIPKQLTLAGGARIKIGRQTSATTTPGEHNGIFDSQILSRLHAEVWEEDSGIYIRDVKSLNGTFINGERLSAEWVESEPWELKSEDVVEFGMDIFDEDQKIIIHRNIMALAFVVLTPKDAQEYYAHLQREELAKFTQYQHQLQRRQAQPAQVTAGPQQDLLSDHNVQLGDLGGLAELQPLKSTMDGVHGAIGGGVVPEITSRMTISEVIAHLGTRGCPDLNDQLDETSCSKYPISNGGYGDVYRAKLRDGTEVAIKTMRLLLDAEGQKHIKHAARELYTWSKCRHRNVQRLLGLVEFRDQIGMVSTWEMNGDLSGYLQRHPEADRYQISAQIAEGLTYLHQSSIVSPWGSESRKYNQFGSFGRALNLPKANVLVSVDGFPLLSDFGNATMHEYTLKFTQTATKTGISSRWAAPELIMGIATYSAPADVYALGMEAITGSLPWSGKSELAVIFAVANREYPKRPVEQIPASSARGDMLWALLKQCWAHEPGDRPSAREVKEFMQGLAREEITLAQSEPGELGPM
ncbi:hypothetical protein FRC12_000123 [Ceratobasidium sp. 428]|nr:hypothetical protein FRC12_000123 [Ceratobasidium sp. 428]